MSYQQINLYQKTARRSGITLNLTTMAIGTVLLVALLMTLALTQQSTNNLLAEQLDNLKGQVQQLDDSTNELKKKLAVGDTDNLEQRLQQVQQQLAHLQQVRNLMAQQQSQRQSSFSEKLTGLSQNHLKGISLQRIHLLNGGSYLSLSGDAHPAEVVPQYLQKLQDDERFNNARFGPLQMERAEGEQGPIQFQLGDVEVQP